MTKFTPCPSCKLHGYHDVLVTRCARCFRCKFQWLLRHID
jgi:predicted Zn-ribbon and HTH transcriptional regulator